MSFFHKISLFFMTELYLFFVLVHPCASCALSDFQLLESCALGDLSAHVSKAVKGFNTCWYMFTIYVNTGLATTNHGSPLTTKIVSSGQNPVACWQIYTFEPECWPCRVVRKGAGVVRNFNRYSWGESGQLEPVGSKWMAANWWFLSIHPSTLCYTTIWQNLKCT